MNTLQTGAMLLLNWIVVSCASVVGPDPETNRLVEELRERYRLPALAVVVANQDRVLVAGASGVTRVDGKEPITIHSPFHMGSVSKPITSAVVGALIERGQFNWDTRLFDLFPELGVGARAEYSPITLRQLLSHTAGIQPFEEDEEFQSSPTFRGSDRERRLGFAKYLLSLEPVALPGSKHVYSNAGYTIISAAVEHLMQEDFRVIADQLLFEPLGLESAGAGPPSSDEAATPWGHSPAANTWVVTDPAADEYLRTLILPAGDFHMNLLDLARFGREQLRGLRGLAGLVQPMVTQMMHREVLDGYALGWNTNDRHDSHLGGLEGMHTALLLIMKSEGLVFAVATNAEIEDTSVFADVIRVVRQRQNLSQ